MHDTDNTPANQAMLETLAKMVQDNQTTMTAFSQAMHERGELSLRIAKRTTLILRMGMIGMLIVNGILFFLVSTLSHEIKTMTGSVVEMASQMGSMEHNIKGVAGHMASMNQHMGEINTQVAQMSHNIQPLPVMADTMQSLTGTIGHMDQTMQGITGYMGQLSAQTGQIGYQMGLMNGNVGQMTHDVDKMAQPMRFFPF